ncbi:putative hydrolase [Sphingobium sp. SYK-6]|uniref:amidohydrolase family protein n=1 Tax=Sphingobium sp. (strain NBRC 103272 / SYK-6) TaxID=627192 RepID=UPI00022776E6|nr:amidohydrolase family protein [Sphingobium sp. SYK-6]BAK66211.1 putative hydrolase [Sphingobium sp. SYK-6]
MPFRLIDTHAHLVSDDWETYPPRPFGPGLPTPERSPFTVTAEQLIAMMDDNGVDFACLVQRGHIYGYDNSYILDSAIRYPDRFRPVVILDTQDPGTPETYRRLVKEGQAFGFRMAQSRPWLLDTAWMSSPVAMEVWDVCAEFGTPMALIIFNNQLSYVLPLVKLMARRYPQLPIILDHAGTYFGASQYEVALAEEAGTPIVMPPPPDWGIESSIHIFEDDPNVYFKITEINMERFLKAGVKSADFVRQMVDRFGPDRLMWGSDVGQSRLWTYPEKVAMAQSAAASLTSVETQKFLHGNANHVYGGGRR